MNLKAFAFLTFALSVATAGAAAEPKFSAKPAVKRSNDKVKITFAVSAPCPVQVEILDSAGKVVRHLGGGVLGENPPEPFGKGLKQELAWDGRDDSGKAASGGPFKVRVGLGLSAEFERIIGWNGQNMDYPYAMAVGPQGTLYSLHGKNLSGHRRTRLITAYDSDGKYLRQVFPSPGGLPAEQRKGWPHVRLADGNRVPVVHHVLTRCVHPGAFFGDGDHSNLAVTPDGKQLIAVGGAHRSLSSQIKHSDTRGGRRLLIFNTDGTVPQKPLGPIVVSEKTNGKPFLALSPDGKYAYVSGFGGGGYHGKQALHNVVYRVEVAGEEKAKPFIGKLKAAGSGKNRLNTPRGVAVDKDGNVYVADSGNKRVAVFEPDGKFLAEIALDAWAEDLAVSHKTGGVYARLGQKLVKFASLKKPSKVAEANLPRPPFKTKRKPACVMALDDSGDSPAFYLGAVVWIKSAFGKYLDKGTSFESLGNPIRARIGKGDPGLPFINQVAVVPGRLITAMPGVPNCNSRYMSYDPVSGKYLGMFSLRKPGGDSEGFKTLHFCGGETSAGKDGRLYHQTGGFDWPQKKRYNPGTIRRYSGEGRASAWPALKNYFIRKYYQGHHRQVGRFATRSGDLYLANFAGYRGRDQKEPGLDVTVISPQGKVKNPSIVRIVGATAGGIAVDPRGNIYLGVQAWPSAKRLPEWIDGKLPPSSRHRHPLKAYHQHGAIVKFPPSGGKIVLDPAGKYCGKAGGYAGRRNWKREKDKSVRLGFEGVEWYRRAGYIAINSGSEVGCGCENTRFDVDDHGRVLVPDLFRFRVTVLDGAGNEVARFGGYGNMDNRGPKSARPVPAIAYGWPIALQVCGDRVYVADTNNRRIVVAKLNCKASATCPVR
jgi:DNA-binding beta-propeller fold protein YncE